MNTTRKPLADMTPDEPSSTTDLCTTTQNCGQMRQSVETRSAFCGPRFQPATAGESGMAQRQDAARREAMRAVPHTYQPGALNLCAACAGGRVFWVHRPQGCAA